MPTSNNGSGSSVNRATAFKLGASYGKQNRMSGCHRIGEPFPENQDGNTEETLGLFCKLYNDQTSYKKQRRPRCFEG